MPATDALSPMMQQYHQAKEAAGDALLLFRMGDFYELFYDDARIASELLGITLTTRDKDKGRGRRADVRFSTSPAGHLPGPDPPRRPAGRGL